MTVDELRQLTEYHLSQNIRPDGSLSLGRASPMQVHVFTRLIAGWSKLLWWDNDDDDDDDDGVEGGELGGGNGGLGASLSRRERLLAAEMAEQCLRELIEEEDARRSAVVARVASFDVDVDVDDEEDDGGGDVDDGDDGGGGRGRRTMMTTTAATTTTSPDLYYLVMRAWLNVDKGGSSGRNHRGGGDGDGGRYLRHASSLLDLMERRFSSSSSSSAGAAGAGAAAAVAPRSMDDDDGDAVGRARCYALVLDGHCKSRLEGSEIRAEGVLRRMLSNNAATTTMTGAGCNSGDVDHSKGAAAAAGAGGGAASIVRHYNNVMNRIASGGKPNAGAEAERLLDELIGTSSPGSSPSPSGSSRRRHRTRIAGVHPDRNSYNAVMKAYANARETRGEDRISNVERILGIMEGRSKSSSSEGGDGGDAGRGRRDIVPEKVSYTTLLTAYASGGRGNDGVGKAYSPSSSCGVDAGERAEMLLERMTNAYVESGNADVKPDTVTYNAVLKVW